MGEIPLREWRRMGSDFADPRDVPRPKVREIVVKAAVATALGLPYTDSDSEPLTLEEVKEIARRLEAEVFARQALDRGERELSEPVTECDLCENVARAFHETYERLAPELGYRTREESAKPWKEVPEKNRNLMTATVHELRTCGVIARFGP